jgi:hypothetical protein
MLELTDLAELAFRDEGRFQDVTEEERITGKHIPYCACVCGQRSDNRMNDSLSVVIAQFFTPTEPGC